MRHRARLSGTQRSSTTHVIDFCRTIRSLSLNVRTLFNHIFSIIRNNGPLHLMINEPIWMTMNITSIYLPRLCSPLFPTEAPLSQYPINIQRHISLYKDTTSLRRQLHLVSPKKGKITSISSSHPSFIFSSLPRIQVSHPHHLSLSSSFWFHAFLAMSGENRALVIDELVEFEKQLI